MRIRLPYIVLLLVAAGGAYSLVSVIASFAEIKAVGEQVTAAASARAQRSPAPEPAVVREPQPLDETSAFPEAEPSGSIDEAGGSETILEPSAEQALGDPSLEDFGTTEDEQRSPLPGEDTVTPDEESVEFLHDLEPTFEDEIEDRADSADDADGADGAEPQ